MVELTNTASNPETVMIKLAHTPVAVPTVSTSVGLYDEACLTESFLWHLDFLDEFHALHTLFIVHFFDYYLRIFIIL